MVCHVPDDLCQALRNRDRPQVAIHISATLPTALHFLINLDTHLLSRRLLVNNRSLWRLPWCIYTNWWPETRKCSSKSGHAAGTQLCSWSSSRCTRPRCHGCVLTTWQGRLETDSKTSTKPAATITTTYYRRTPTSLRTQCSKARDPPGRVP